MKKSILVVILCVVFNVCYAQDNPYAIFGYKSKIQYKTPETDVYKVINNDTTSDVKYLLFDRDKKTVSLYDKKNEAIKTIVLSDDEIARWTSIDPLAAKYPQLSPYNFVDNNPIRMVDPNGMEGTDFVKGKLGNIYWDKNANSQATTKQGETYLGKTLTFNFTSYIDKKTWDGPTLGGLVDPSGVKLSSTITLTGRENAAGDLTSIVGTASSHPGETPMGTARDYYPGAGGSNNVFDVSSTSTGASLNFEQHASVSPSEQFGLNAMGFKIVDVAQRLNINYTSSTGGLSISSATDIFPSANLKMNGSTIMQYNQPSFVGTHTAPIVGSTTPTAGSLPIRNFSYYPSTFYPR